MAEEEEGELPLNAEKEEEEEEEEKKEEEGEASKPRSGKKASKWHAGREI